MSSCLVAVSTVPIFRKMLNPRGRKSTFSLGRRPYSLAILIQIVFERMCRAGRIQPAVVSIDNERRVSSKREIDLLCFQIFAAAVAEDPAEIVLSDFRNR